MTESEQLVCGVDLGGTNTRIAIAGRDGHIIARDRGATPAGSGELLAARIAEWITDLAGSVPAATVIGVPGAVHPATGRIRTVPNLPQLRGDAFTRQLPRARFVNDANAALFGELHAGAARGRRDVVMVTVGTGVGTAVLLDGRPLTGRSGAIGEFGELPYEDGTLEEACSGTALTRAAHAAGFPDGSGVFTEPALRPARDRAFHALSILLATVTTAYEPEVIVLGGGVATSLAPWCDRLRRHLSTITPEPPDVLITELGDDAGLLGAVHLALTPAAEPALA